MARDARCGVDRERLSYRYLAVLLTGFPLRKKDRI
jgi:hypothetical protein